MLSVVLGGAPSEATAQPGDDRLGRSPLGSEARPRRLTSVLPVEVARIPLAEVVPWLVPEWPLEVPDRRVRPGLRQFICIEVLVGPGVDEKAVHAVPARLEHQPPLAEHGVERILVPEDQRLGMV